ncbi:peroxidase-related enzyme [Streptomyces sp. MBT56]|uniref:carboxymuconolactone decarboxylase family protein n=1 Tax=unclassified Streptomyces TaxID=2593676 RepID=UPI001909ECE9|nr:MULTISPECIES: peroxidase-related enzyme [unclassified Streptomyces]MBK3555263.1 peroxidase-related enzyme [Streptomyces sp. MBT56]MBK3607067.1 peroxidase-related enzyme [Streptomyces sp. MBT54]MBK3618258.1 peroxidase-related enzyme [Streptomyces sp. MBT98]
MPHIEISNDHPGIRGLMFQRPDAAAPLNHLANVLLRAPASLSRGERELIAAYVSHLNDTPFCAGTHGAAAAAQLDGGHEAVTAVFAAPQDAPVSPRMRALLAVAAEVMAAARPVGDETVAAARAAGAEDSDIHDTVLIAAAFCMYNRYVSCLATGIPTQDDYYQQAADRIVTDGYATASGRNGTRADEALTG